MTNTNAIINAYTSSDSTLVEICSEFSISKSKLYKLLDENNVARRGKGALTSIEKSHQLDMQRAKEQAVDYLAELANPIEDTPVVAKVEKKIAKEKKVARVELVAPELDFSKVTITKIETIMDVASVAFEASDNTPVTRKHLIEQTYAAWKHMIANRDTFTFAKRMAALADFNMEPSMNTVSDITMDYRKFLVVTESEGVRGKLYSLIA